MRKLTTKLLFAIISVAFALVALGTTTFAWFTLTNEATISKFKAQITAGEGIEISIDGTNYYTTIPTNIIQAEINKLKVTLKDITSPDGVNLYPLGNQEEDKKIPFYPNPDADQTNQFIQFDLWVRSTTPTNVFIDTIDLSATPIDWLADTTFTNAKGNTVYPYVDIAAAVAAGVTIINPDESLFGQQTYDASDALRMSFALDGATTANFVYEKPESTSNTVLNQTPQLNGAVHYYNQKNGLNSDTTNNHENYTGLKYYEAVVAESITTFVNQDPILVLSDVAEEDGYYYGKIDVRIWVEGWDPDTFNAILNAEIFARIVFTSDPYIEQEVDPE